MIKMYKSIKAKNTQIKTLRKARKVCGLNLNKSVLWREREIIKHIYTLINVIK